MNFKILMGLLALMICSCQVNNDSKKLSRKIDSLNQHIQSLGKLVNAQHKNDTVIVASKKVEKVVPTIKKEKIIKEAPTKTVVTTIEQKQTPEIFYFKTAPQSKSVEVGLWNNGRRTITFYDHQGNVTYTCHDMRMSFSIVTELKSFHKNGAIDKIEIHNNPDAGMYWYITEIAFDENNQPLWKTETRMPERSVAESLNNKYLWNSDKKTWVKQEIAVETIHP
jgi:hypothetical protein